MIRRPPRSTRTDTLFPYTTLFRTLRIGGALSAVIRNQLPVAYGCDGQRVPEDIEPGRANSLVLRAMQLARTTPARIDDATLALQFGAIHADRKSTRLNSSH